MSVASPEWTPSSGPRANCGLFYPSWGSWLHRWCFFAAVKTTTMLGSPANSRWCMWGPCNSCPSRDSHHSLTNDQQKPWRNHRNHEPLWKSFTWTSTSCLEPRNHTCQIPSLGHPSSSCGKTQRRSIPWRTDILATLPALCSKQLD